MFTSPLILRVGPPGEWILERTLEWEGRQRIVVPAGFITDLASIPRALRGVLEQNGRSRKAAVLHDWLYSSQRIGTRRITRAQADAVFRQALEAEHVGWVARSLYWSGVRVGGWLPWGKRQEIGGEITPEDFD